MKKALLALMLAASAAVVAWCQPKVAVLDAIIPQNMDPSVIVPATDKIIEKLVQSNRFTVLDRANIESVLKEREFQVSGMVSDQDAVTAGKYLGADFIVVAKVSKVGDTYFISGKMINVKTGVIVSTTSAQGDGKLNILISLAGQVGEVLAGGVATPTPAEPKEVVVTPPPEDKAPAEQPEPAPASYGGERHALTENFVSFGIFYNKSTWKWSGDYSPYSDSDEIDMKLATLQCQIIAAKYIQMGIGYTWFTSGTEDSSILGSSVSGDYLKGYRIGWLDLNFLFRIPIQFGRNSPVAFVPMAGFEYDICIIHKDANGNDFTINMNDDQKSDLSKFYFQLGFGFQIDAGSSVVLCPELIYGFKIHSKIDDDIEKAEGLLGYSNSTITAGRLDLGVLVGFKI